MWTRWAGGGEAGSPALGVCFEGAGGHLDLLVVLGDDELDQSGLGRAEALARQVDHVGEVRARLGQRVLEQLAVVAARLAAERLAQVAVVQLAELGVGPLELRLGPRAEARDQLLVVAANAAWYP